MIKHTFLYLAIGSILYLSLSDSLLKSQKIHCNNGIELACNYLMEASQKQSKGI
tara:strand:- start:33 stop:194 length:162 start_codon:yes stop_codon:yes gene_type:complete